MTIEDLFVKYGNKQDANMLWCVVQIMSDEFEPIEETDNCHYWYILRKIYGKMSGYHYNEDFAKYDVAEMKPLGEYWSLKQIEDATRGLTFPSGTTLYDKYVAFNSSANDYHGVLTDDEILKASYAFWFNDVDWKSKPKVWAYNFMNHKKK